MLPAAGVTSHFMNSLIVGQEFVTLRRGNHTVEGSRSRTVHTLYASFETAELSRRNMHKRRVCEIRISSWLPIANEEVGARKQTEYILPAGP